MNKKPLEHHIQINKLIILIIIQLIFFIIFSPLIVSLFTVDKTTYTKETYAIIVVGRYTGRWQDALPKYYQQYYTWYLNSAAMMYTMLKSNYGYTDEQIFLLVNLKEQYTIPDSFKSDWIDYASNKHNLQQLISKFKPGGEMSMTENDSLFFVYINHGLDEDEKINGKYAHNTYFGFPLEINTIKEFISYFILKKNHEDYKLYDWELAEYIENIHAGKMIFVLQPCYSGGFINDLSGINHIICTASRENEPATVSWIEHFIRGLMGLADANGDAKISILETYEYAARKVQEKTANEHPLIDDNDDGIGHHFSEIGYNPTDQNADGYVSARTYL